MERDFKGVWIPKEVWLDERLGILDKINQTAKDLPLAKRCSRF